MSAERPTDGPDTELAAAIGYFRGGDLRADYLARGGEYVGRVMGEAAATIVRAYLAAQGVELDGDAPDFPDHETIGKVRREVARSTERNEFGAYIKTPVLRRIADLAERAVLARPAAGRDLTAQDVRAAVNEAWRNSPPTWDAVAEHLTSIARPAVARTDGQPPAGEPTPWEDLPSDDRHLTLALCYAARATRDAVRSPEPRLTSTTAAWMAEWLVDHGWSPSAAPADDTAAATAPWMVESRDERVDRLTRHVENVADCAGIEIEVREAGPLTGPAPLRRLVRALEGAGMLHDDPADDTAPPTPFTVDQEVRSASGVRGTVRVANYTYSLVTWSNGNVVWVRNDEIDPADDTAAPARTDDLALLTSAATLLRSVGRSMPGGGGAVVLADLLVAYRDRVGQPVRGSQTEAES